MQKIYYSNIMVENLNQDVAKLKLPRRKYFQLGETLICYDWNQDREVFLNIYIKELDGKAAKKRLTDIVNLFSYLYQFDMIGLNELHVEEVEELPDVTVINIEETSNINLKSIITFYTKLDKLEEKIKGKIYRSISYHARTRRLLDLELLEEAFLIAYKSVENIAEYIFSKSYKGEFDNEIKSYVKRILKNHFNEDYKEQGKDLEISKAIEKELKGLVTARRKIMKCVDHLGLNELKEGIGKLVQFRNKIGAHASSLNEKVPDELMLDILVLSAFVISRMVTEDDNIIKSIKGDNIF